MIAIEIRLNGKKERIAGIADGTVDVHLALTCRRHWRKEPKASSGLLLSGMDSKRDEHIEWADLDLAVGDEIVMRLVQTSKVDQPTKRSRMTSRQAKESFVRQMAEDLGWKIQTK